MTDDEIIESARKWLLAELDHGFVPGRFGFIVSGRNCSSQQLIEHHPDREMARIWTWETDRPRLSDWKNGLMNANDGEGGDIVTRVRAFLERTESL